MYKFLLKPNWIAAHIFVILLALGFLSLGFWQLNRLSQIKSHNQIFKNSLSQDTQTLSNLANKYNFDTDTEELKYLSLKLIGHYDPDYEVLLRGRSHLGQPGYTILSPFITIDKHTIMIERGWVPINYDSPPIKEALPPSGEIEIIGRIYPSQKSPTAWSAKLAPKDPEGNLQITAYADTKRLSQQMPYELLGFYLKLEKQNPNQNSDLPYELLAPTLSNGSHLSYALQWFSFVLIGLVGYALIIRKRLVINSSYNNLAED